MSYLIEAVKSLEGESSECQIYSPGEDIQCDDDTLENLSIESGDTLEYTFSEN